MRKLKLSVDDLRVDSFHAVELPAKTGTVVAHTGRPWCGTDSLPLSCNGTCDTCWETCDTCDYSCAC